MNKTFLIALVLVACAGPAQPSTSAAPGLDLGSMKAMGCGDAVVYLVNSGGTALITINLPGLAGAATDAPTRSDFSATEVTTITYGRHLDQLVCNDALEFEPVVLSEEPATGGSVVTTAARVGGGDGLTNLDVTLEGLRFGDLVTTPDPYGVPRVQVGWFVG